MPTWLVHGFRWPRRDIRIHIILHNLEDCAAEYLMAEATVAELTADFRKSFPEETENLAVLQFIEQYDPDDQFTKDQPYAYVCDQVHDVELSLDVEEIRDANDNTKADAGMAALRDKVAPGAKLGWFVVVNGDPERWAPPEEEEQEGSDFTTEFRLADTQAQIRNPTSSQASTSMIESSTEEVQQRGFKKWLGKVRRMTSSKDLRNTATAPSTAQTPPASPSKPPPLPEMPPNYSRPRTMDGKRSIPAAAPVPKDSGLGEPSKTSVAIEKAAARK